MSEDTGITRQLAELVGTLATEGADGRAGLRTLLREIEAKYPGEIDRMAAGLTLQRVRPGLFAAQ